tara:strand:- start:113 stop:1210 length:1098 start_codon:yes stop_codon:yes gene_type:complete
MSTKTTTTISSFLAVASKLPPEIAVLMQGPTGIGKSFLAKQVAEDLDLPFIPVFGSTMSEGDVGGYPDIESMKETGVMTFCMPSWFIRACSEPCVVMLDELNRSLPGVQQSFFQLVLDRALGNDKNGAPYKLHPNTRIFAAVNVGSEYDVNEMDPALLRRFWAVNLEPSTQDWIDWAKQNSIDKLLIEFVSQNPAHLRVDPSTVEPGTVCPNPASWHRVDTCLKHMNVLPSNFAGKEMPDYIYTLLLGMVGVEAAIAFNEFVKNADANITAEDVLAGMDLTVLENVSTGIIIGICDKIKEHCCNNDWNASEAANIAAFSEVISDELTVTLWGNISSSGNLKNISAIHQLIGAKVTKIVQTSRNLK